jgi:hypothetical protein
MESNEVYQQKKLMVHVCCYQKLSVSVPIEDIPLRSQKGTTASTKSALEQPSGKKWQEI